MSARFEGRVVLVAGGTGGLGRAASSAFLDEGADVAVTYRNQPEWEASQSSASANAVRLHGHAVDVTDEAAVTRVVEKILLKHDRLAITVNAVGAYATGPKAGETKPMGFEQVV